MSEKEMQAKASELRREYARRWRAANPDKVKAAQQRYWLKQAAKFSEKEAANDAH